MKTFDIVKRDGSIHTVIVDDEDYFLLEEHSWHIHQTGYACRTVVNGDKWDKIFLHREILKTTDGFDTDHINRNRLDNRKENLRIVSRKKNKENSSLYNNNTSGTSGVSWHKMSGKWMAYINHNSARIHLGIYSTRDEAIAVRKAKEIELNWYTNVKS